MDLRQLSMPVATFPDEPTAASWEKAEVPVKRDAHSNPDKDNAKLLKIEQAPAATLSHTVPTEPVTAVLSSHDSAIPLGQQACKPAGCIQPSSLEEYNDDAGSIKAVVRKLRHSRGPTWLCGGASFKKLQDSKVSQDKSPRKWASHAAALQYKAGKEAKSGVGEHYAVDHAGSVTNDAPLKRPSSSNMYTAQATLAVHDSTSSLNYDVSACEQSSKTTCTSQVLEDGLRAADRHTCSLKAEWLIDPVEIYFCAKTSGRLYKLGKGTFGTVYKGICNEELVAVKVCRKMHVTQKAMDAFAREVAILHSCRNARLVQLKGACSWKNGRRTVLVTEYMPNGDLYTAIGRDPHRFAWNALGKGIALDAARGLSFLHSQNIVHFDLKSANVLLDRKYRAKLADVGLAKSLTQYHGSDNLCTFMATGDIGTFAWAAPEVLLGFPCDEKADIFSFGVLMWELCTTDVPQSRSLRPVRVPEECSQSVADLLTICMAPDPLKRPTADGLVDILKL